MAHASVRGSCLCGEVRWEVDGPLDAPTGGPDFLALLGMSHCHCARCRKAHGAPYATYLVVREERFQITHGRERIVARESAPGGFRPFCDQCGSVVPDGRSFQGHVVIPAGLCDEDPGRRPTPHIFVASKASWVTITDELPRFDAYPPGFEAPPIATRPSRDPEGSGARGSCLCGEVAYLVTAPPIRCRTCHCSRCRKAGSAAHVSYLVTHLDGVRFTRGEDLLVTYKVPDARYFKTRFCRACGSNMPRFDAERQIALVPMGSLDDDPGVRPARHIYAGSLAPWDAITDGLPQDVEHTPS